MVAIVSLRTAELLGEARLVVTGSWTTQESKESKECPEERSSLGTRGQTAVSSLHTSFFPKMPNASLVPLVFVEVLITNLHITMFPSKLRLSVSSASAPN